MRAFIVAFLDKSIADFTGKHFLFIFWLLVKVLDFSVLGSEDGEDWDEVESFQCHLCLNRMFKGLLEVIRRVQDTPVVDISHVDFELPAVGLGLRRFNCYTTLAGDSADGHFAHTAEQRFVWCVGRWLAKSASHDFFGCVAVAATQMGWQLCAK